VVRRARFSSSARKLLLNRLDGAIYKAITSSTRAEQRRSRSQGTNAIEPGKALYELAQGIVQPYRPPLDNALARVRVLCPQTQQG